MVAGSMIRTILALIPALLLALLACPPADADERPIPIEGLDVPESVLAFSSGFLAEDLPIEGTVLEDATDTKLIIESRRILYLRMANFDHVAPGALYTVYRRIHQVFHPAHGRYLGWLIGIRGIVQVTKVDLDLGIATVNVVRAFDAITPGDAVMPFTPPAAHVPPPPDRSLPEIAAMVVELSPKQTIVGQRNVVYIDWGRREGLMRGDHLDVFRPKLGRPLRLVGELRVLSVQDHTATALIVKSPVNILRGDRLAHKVPPATAAQAEDQLKPLEGDNKGVEVKREGETLVITLVDQVLFDSGQAEIKPSGREVLYQVSEALRGATDRKILVEGHTDNVRIGRKLRKTFPTNWELSRARAASVRQFLSQEGGIDLARISSAEYADTRPVAPNDTEEGRQKNRRVEIILMPKDVPGPAPASQRVPPIVLEEPPIPASPLPVSPEAVVQPVVTPPAMPEPSLAPLSSTPAPGQ